MPRPLDRLDKLALVLCARSGNPLRDNFSLLGYKTMEFLLVLVIDIGFFIFTKAAVPFFPNLVIFFQLFFSFTLCEMTCCPFIDAGFASNSGRRH